MANFHKLSDVPAVKGVIDNEGDNETDQPLPAAFRCVESILDSKKPQEFLDDPHCELCQSAMELWCYSVSFLSATESIENTT